MKDKLSTRLLSDGSVVRKCSGCNQYSSRTIPRSFATAHYKAKYWCEQCLEKFSKYDVPNSLHYLLNFEIIGFAKFNTYLNAKRFKLMIIDRKIHDCSTLIAQTDDICEAIGIFDELIKDRAKNNDEICIEWEMKQDISVQKKYYKKFQVIDFNDIQSHSLFQELSQWERDTLGLGLMLAMTGINVYYSESHVSCL